MTTIYSLQCNWNVNDASIEEVQVFDNLEKAQRAGEEFISGSAETEKERRDFLRGYAWVREDKNTWIFTTGEPEDQWCRVQKHVLVAD